MKEILRIQHGRQDAFPGEALLDYNLEVYEGDIIYIQGDRGSGLRTLIKVLAGDILLKSGALFLWDQRAEDYSRNTALQYQICMITGETDMVTSMSVTDNLEALTPVRFPLQLYNPRHKQRRIQKYLDRNGMHIFAGDYVFHLDSVAQMELGIIKAHLHGAKLIGLDMTGNKYEGREAERLCALIRRMNEEGVSFLIFSEDYSVFMEIAGRIQFLLAGREQKEWLRTRENQELILKKLRRDLFSGMEPVQKRSGEEGFLGLYDGEWEKKEDFWGYFRQVKENNPEVWEQYINAVLPGEKGWDRRRTVMIPMEAAEMLFPNLPLADNIIISVPERVCGNRYGIIKKRIRENIVQGFYQRFQIDSSVGSVEELEWVYRKILAVYRWELARPEVIFLENPYSGLTAEGKKIMTDYLWELKHKKIRIVLLSGYIENLRGICEKIIITRNGKSAKITTI